MKILHIKTVGTFINIPFIGDVRTPASIDVSNMNVESILFSLRQSGLTNYVFYDTDDKKTPIIPISEEEIEKRIIIPYSTMVNKDMEDRLSKIEELLIQIASSKVTSTDNNVQTKIDKNNKYEISSKNNRVFK